MRRHILIVFGLLLAGLSLAHAQSSTYYFPQVANGDFGVGKFKTTLGLANPGNNPVTINVVLTTDTGGTFSIFPGLESGSVTLGPGNSRIFQSDGTGPLTAGAATITSNAPIGATVIFSQFDAAGNLQTEAGVTSARTLRNFTIPVDLSGSYNTGVAFFKPGSGSASVTLNIFDESGAAKGQGNVPLVGSGHRAAFVPDFFPSLRDFTRGSLVISSDADIAAVALRTGSGVGPVITTLPVTDAQSSYNFPQVANGSFTGGNFKTTLILNNSGTSSADVTVGLTTDTGSAFSIFPGLESGRVTLAPRTTRVFQSDGSGPLVAGAAAITANNPVIAALIFSQFDDAGRLQTEAGVASARTSRALTIPVDLSTPFNTGVALFKLGAGSGNITFILLDAAGADKGRATRTLVGNGHTATFVPDLFPGLSGFGRGALSITSDSDITAVALRTGSGTVPVITTLPVIDGAYVPQGGAVSYAGSFDGTYTVQGGPGSGTLTLVMRQDGSTVTGRVGHETAEGCVHASEFTGTLSGASLTATARSLTGNPNDTTLNLTLSGDQITGTLRTGACAASAFTGQFTLRKLPGSNPPDLNGRFEGGVWNEEDSARSFGYIVTQTSGRDFRVVDVGVATPIGLVTGTATGQLNEQGDRVENLSISLAVAGSTLTLNGEVSVSRDGRIIFGGLRTPPGELINLRGSLRMRRN